MTEWRARVDRDEELKEATPADQLEGRNHEDSDCETTEAAPWLAYVSGNNGGTGSAPEQRDCEATERWSHDSEATSKLERPSNASAWGSRDLEEEEASRWPTADAWAPALHLMQMQQAERRRKSAEELAHIYTRDMHNNCNMRRAKGVSGATTTTTTRRTSARRRAPGGKSPWKRSPGGPAAAPLLLGWKREGGSSGRESCGTRPDGEPQGSAQRPARVVMIRERSEEEVVKSLRAAAAAAAAGGRYPSGSRHGKEPMPPSPVFKRRSTKHSRRHSLAGEPSHRYYMI